MLNNQRSAEYLRPDLCVGSSLVSRKGIEGASRPEAGPSRAGPPPQHQTPSSSSRKGCVFFRCVEVGMPGTARSRDAQGIGGGRAEEFEFHP
jgi:hypothetical protein